MATFTPALISLLLPFCVSQYINYNKYKVYRVLAKNANEVDFLVNYKNSRTSVDFWTPIRLGNPIDIMVPPILQFDFTFQMKFHEIEFSLLISNVNTILRKERMVQKSKFSKFSINKYNQYDSIISFLKKLEKNYKKIVKVEYPGTSFEGRDIPMVKISTGGSGKPIILIDAGMHAREWIAPAMALYVIYQLVGNTKNRFMIEQVDWYIIPTLNPDGYEYTHKRDRFWRKTRSSGGICKGVDPNRNFNFHWAEVGASLSECDDDYAGSFAMSEPEVNTLARVVKDSGSLIKLYLSFHSFGNLILYPWGHTTELPANAVELQALGEKVADAIGAVAGTKYKVGSSSNVLYAAAGGSEDWAKGVGGVDLVYTIELPGGGFLGFDLPSDKIISVGKETFEGIKVYHKYILEKFGTK